MTEREFSALATKRDHKSHAKASSGIWRTRGPVSEVKTRYVEPRKTSPSRAQLIYGFGVSQRDPPTRRRNHAHTR